MTRDEAIAELTKYQQDFGMVCLRLGLRALEFNEIGHLVEKALGYKPHELEDMLDVGGWTVATGAYLDVLTDVLMEAKNSTPTDDDILAAEEIEPCEPQIH